jgi:hypothetical protein
VGLMDKNKIERKLPKSFEKLQAFIANILKSDEDEEEKKASEAMEQEKYKAFCKVLDNIQFAYITQQDSNKADVKEMLESMSG